MQRITYATFVRRRTSVVELRTLDGEDVVPDRAHIDDALDAEGHETTCCWELRQAQRKLNERLHDVDEGDFDIAIVDIDLDPLGAGRDYPGIRFARELQETMPGCAVILMSAEGRATTFNVADVIRESCQLVLREARRQHVEGLRSKEPVVYLKCQRGVLERVLCNIRLNAVQQIGLSLRPSGFVQVTHRLGPQNELIIRVYDNGAGIHGFRRSRILQPGETSRPDGCGLGLAICRQELRKMGDADVRLGKSVLFCGTCVEVVIRSSQLVGPVGRHGRKK